MQAVLRVSFGLIQTSRRNSATHLRMCLPSHRCLFPADGSHGGRVTEVTPTALGSSHQLHVCWHGPYGPMFRSVPHGSRRPWAGANEGNEGNEGIGGADVLKSLWIPPGFAEEHLIWYELR